jgi:CO dehydrogenase/acetyl-CoA synthase beta subunit
MAVALSVSVANASDLAFLAEAVNNSNGEKYKAYLDLSTRHREGTYETIKLLSIYEKPITAAGYAGVKSMVNTFQIDCRRNVKRVTYIGFLNSQGQVIVDKEYPNASDEGFGEGTVDRKIQPYLCGK